MRLRNTYPDTVFRRRKTVKQKQAFQYAYCANNPVKFIELDGRDWILSTGNRVYWYGGKYGDKSNLLYSYKATSGMNNTIKTTTFPNGQTKQEVVNTQQAKYQRISNVGPTPEGKYKINLEPSPDRVAEANLKTGELKRNPEGGIEKIPKFVANPDKPGYGWTYNDWGENRAKMDPIIVTGATSQERDLSSFYLHDSQKGYSHGCTEVEGELFDKLKEYREAGNTSIDVKVEYPNEDHKTNGGTKKTNEN